MKTRPSLRMRGVSLIELMIALAIGTLLVLGLVEVFAASRVSYQLSEGMSRVQENGRFAVDYLQRDIRMAGHFGCVNDQAHARQDPAGLSTTFAATPASGLLFGVSIQGYEALDTEPGKTVTLSETPTTNGINWTPALPVDIADKITDRVNGSDIIVLRYLAPEGVPVTSIGGTAAEPIFNFDASRWDVLRSGVANPGLFAVADCMSAAVFQAAGGGATDGANGIIAVGGTASAPNNVVAFSKVFTPGQATLFRAESVVYYVGLNDEGEPSLYRLRFVAEPGETIDSQKEELVEGIENMQMLYGQDREIDPTKSPSGYIEQLETANGIQASATPTPADAWRRVGSVQVGLVGVSPDRAAAMQAGAANELMAMGVKFAAPNDGRYRTAYQSTLALRNRLYGN